MVEGSAEGLTWHGPPLRAPATAAACSRRVWGQGPLSRHLRTLGLSAAADACFAVSLAGSLFFSVSVTAARPRVILYLVLTVIPFVLVAPFIGPVVDRYRGGHRVVITAVCASRALICILLAGHLQTLFVYPEALAVLALGKVYSVVKSAIVPGLVPRKEELVDANARLARVSAVAGAVGAGIGAGVATVAGASSVLVVAACVYGVAALTATRLPNPGRELAVSRALEYEEVHAPAPMLAGAAMAVLRAGMGFLAFLLAFSLRDAGEPAWFFGLALVAAGVGAFFGTFVASQLRRVLHEEQMLALALALPAVFILAAGVQVGRASVLGAAVSLGMGASVGRQAFDSLIQHKVPLANRGRLFSRFETGFQLAWALGALAPVVLRPRTWVGLLVLSAVMIGASVAYVVLNRATLRFEMEAGPTRAWLQRRLAGGSPPLEAVILLDAGELAAHGAHRQAVIEAATAYEVLVERTLGRHLAGSPAPEATWGASLSERAVAALPEAVLRASPFPPDADPVLRRAWLDLGDLRRRATCADGELTTAESDHAIASAGRLVDALRSAQLPSHVPA